MPDPVDPARLDPLVRRVVDAAARKGATLGIVVLDASTHTAADAAGALGVELGQIVKSLVFVAPREEAGNDPVVCLVAGSNRAVFPVAPAALRNLTNAVVAPIAGQAASPVPARADPEPAALGQD